MKHGSETLVEILSQFQGANGNEDFLETQFYKLAKYFLYSGYLLVNGKKKVYLRDVEFYYHEEEGEIKDPIVYHRNTKTNKNVPYFPLGTLNAHNSGIDISFENEEKKCRASMLIRGFNILEGDSQLPIEYDRHSTHIYQALFMSFSLFENIHIEWIHEPTLVKEHEINKDFRVNVCKFDEKGNKIACKEGTDQTENKKYVQDKRLWRFIRKIE